jgi:hypothetical protein
VRGSCSSSRLLGEYGPLGARHRGPPSSPRVRQIPYDPIAYRQRSLVERTNCRIKDFRAIATRYDKLALNFLAGLCLVTALIYWCGSVHTLADRLAQHSRRAFGPSLHRPRWRCKGPRHAIVVERFAPAVASFRQGRSRDAGVEGEP